LSCASTTTDSHYPVCECCPQKDDSNIGGIEELLSNETLPDGQKLLAAFQKTFFVPGKKKRYKLTTHAGVAGRAVSASMPAEAERPAREVLMQLLPQLTKSKNWQSVSTDVQDAVNKLYQHLSAGSS